jgi:O-antigen/teichoic acid export membrane protein
VLKEEPPLLGRIAKYGAFRIFGGLMAYAVAILLIRILPFDEYGRYSVSIASTQVLSILTYGWIFASIPRQVAGADGPDFESALGAVVLAFGLSSAVLVPLYAGAFVAGFLSGSMALVVAALALIVGNGTSESALAVANARGNTSLFWSLSLARYGLMLALVITLGFISEPSAVAVIWFLAIAGFSWTLFLPRHWRVLMSAVQRADLSASFRLFLVGLPSVIAFGLYPLMIGIDRVVIAHEATPGAAGILGGVSDVVAGPLLLVFQIVNLAMAPSLFAAANRGDMAQARIIGGEMLGTHFSIIAPAVVTFLWLGSALSQAVLGDSLRPEAHQIFPFIAATVVCVVLFNTAAGILIAGRHQSSVAILSIIALAASALVAREFASSIGGIGPGLLGVAAAASVLALGLCWLLVGASVPLRHLMAGISSAAVSAIAIAICQRFQPMLNPIAPLAASVVLSAIISIAFNVLDVRTALASKLPFLRR